MTNPKKNFVPITDITPMRQEELMLNHDFTSIISTKNQIFEETLNEAIQAYNSLEFSQAAKKFRKLATDINLMEALISHPGNYSERNTLNDLTGKQWLQHSKSWMIVDGTPNDQVKEIKNHPASFPPSLAERLISFFTKSHQWVFDPFMGIGSTAEACKTTNRNCFGIELNPEYCQFAQQRVFETNPKKQEETKQKFIIINDQAQNSLKLWKENNLPLVDFLLTSPPYWNMLKTSRGGVESSQKQHIAAGYDSHYSENAHDYGNIDDLDEYLSQLCLSFINMKPLLRPKAYLVIILQNCRPKDGIMRPIAWDFANRLKQEYSLCQEFIWLQDQKFMGIWGYPTTYVSNVHHHYCLVFQNS